MKITQDWNINKIPTEDSNTYINQIYICRWTHVIFLCCLCLPLPFSSSSLSACPFVSARDKRGRMSDLDMSVWSDFFPHVCIIRGKEIIPARINAQYVVYIMYFFILCSFIRIKYRANDRSKYITMYYSKGEKEKYYQTFFM